MQGANENAVLDRLAKDESAAAESVSKWRLKYSLSHLPTTSLQSFFFCEYAATLSSFTNYPLHLALSAEPRASDRIILALLTACPNIAKKAFESEGRPKEREGHPLHMAIARGCASATVLRILKAYPKAALTISAFDECAMALHLAAYHGASLEVIEALISANPQAAALELTIGGPQQPTQQRSWQRQPRPAIANFRWVPLQWACIAGASHDVIQRLEAATPARFHRHPTLREDLFEAIEAGISAQDLAQRFPPEVEVPTCTHTGHTYAQVLLHHAVRSAAAPSVIATLLEHPALAKSAALERDAYGDLPVHLAFKMRASARGAALERSAQRDLDPSASGLWPLCCTLLTQSTMPRPADAAAAWLWPLCCCRLSPCEVDGPRDVSAVDESILLLLNHSPAAAKLRDREFALLPLQFLDGPEAGGEDLVEAGVGGELSAWPSNSSGPYDYRRFCFDGAEHADPLGDLSNLGEEDEEDEDEEDEEEEDEENDEGDADEGAPADGVTQVIHLHAGGDPRVVDEDDPGVSDEVDAWWDVRGVARWTDDNAAEEQHDEEMDESAREE
jgi:ankyrin repeat protein